jgi:steroid delta-isomerase-like uncharacterized protein
MLPALRADAFPPDILSAKQAGRGRVVVALAIPRTGRAKSWHDISWCGRPAERTSEGGRMPGTANKTLVTRLEDIMRRRALEELDNIVAQDFVRICEATPDVDIHDLDGFKQFLRDFVVAFPDEIQTFTDVAADDNLIGVFATYEGTHQGPFNGIPPTGKRVNFHFAGMFTVRDGKLAEFRVIWDNMTVLAQLGLLPAAAGGS